MASLVAGTPVLTSRRSPLTAARRLISGDPLAVIGIAIVVLLVILAVFGMQIAPAPGRGYGVIDTKIRMLPPSTAHWMGTDDLGRDVFSRVILGAQSALFVSLLVVSIAVLVGVPLGAIAGYRRGRLDGLIMRTTDLFLAFPPLLLAMAITAALGPGLDHAALALAISWWPWYTRIARGSAVAIRELPFVESARAIGLPDRTVVRRHVVPNLLTPVVVQATLDMGTVILAAGALAFIGLGARRPAPEWGLMVADGRGFILDQWWLSTFPGLAIFVATLGFNLVGDYLVRALDPRQRR
jgi:peptide/nickel transport system permease protein